ncbi:hypothetical protein T03_12386 [Trichinella britovi]|uniref:Uncharacterized protein n=1 Tax=Trichinella britovi TaxID=45882 RepID=A0A0V1ALB2_TRIBR|nr:hypothetical protein T03_12386 [Trichinella britovi]
MTLSIVCLVVVSPNEFICICDDVGRRELKETPSRNW